MCSARAIVVFSCQIRAQARATVAGHPATLYFDEIRTPTYTDCLNRLYEEMLTNEFSGIFHAGAPRRLSLYQIAQVINRVGGYDPHCLLGIPRHQAGPIPPRAGNVCMDCGKLILALGYDPFDPWPYCDELAPTHADWHHERPAGEPRSPQRLHEVLCRNPRDRSPGASCDCLQYSSRSA